MNTDPMMKPAGQIDGTAAPLFAPPPPADPPAPAAAGPDMALPEPDPCEKCAALMWWVKNVDSGNVGPVNARTTLYVIDVRTLAADAHGRPLFRGMTGGRWLERVDHVVMRDGTTVPASALVLGVSHFTTCPAAGHFSKKGKGRR